MPSDFAPADIHLSVFIRKVNKPHSVDRDRTSWPGNSGINIALPTWLKTFPAEKSKWYKGLVSDAGGLRMKIVFFKKRSRPKVRTYIVLDY